MIKKGLQLSRSIVSNICSNKTSQLTHVVEASDWAIKQVGEAITKSLNDQNLLHTRISYSPLGLRNQIIHFDSVNTFFHHRTWHRAHPSNQIILTWFHVAPNDTRLKHIQDAEHDIFLMHTSCQSTKKTLTDAGVDEKKIIVIPLGVNIDLFQPGTLTQRQTIREQLGIAQDRLVIGSFQKDGVGWGEGMAPKLIKGPDVFVNVMDHVRDLCPLILLTGPARGYIKSELEKKGIEYRHISVQKFQDIANMYHALDLYLIASRVEGGPLSLLESWASGVPVIATRVGMVPDMSTHDETALLTNSEDVSEISKQVRRLVENSSLRERLISQELIEVKKYSWDKIAQQYFETLYHPLL